MAIVSDGVSKYRWDIGLFTVIVRDGEGSNQVKQPWIRSMGRNIYIYTDIYPITQFKMAIGVNVSLYWLLCLPVLTSRM